MSVVGTHQNGVSGQEGKFADDRQRDEPRMLGRKRVEALIQRMVELNSKSLGKKLVYLTCITHGRRECPVYVDERERQEVF